MTTVTRPTDRRPVRLAVIVGSIRTDRFCLTPARWIADRARQRDELDIDLIDLAEHDLPVVLGGNDQNIPPPAAVVELGERLERADGFIVVTPVYNRSYPAALNNAVD